MKAYLVSHNGMGDNLYMVGALNYLRPMYEHVYFLCKRRYYENIKLFFDISANITCVPFNDEMDEGSGIASILKDKYTDENNDMFICSKFHRSYMRSRINNKDVLAQQVTPNKYTLVWDTLTAINYSFIEEFYTSINLNLNHFYEYFDLPSVKESTDLYNNVNDYYIVFIQSTSSEGTTLNITNLCKKYMNDDKVILLCNDTNLYDGESKDCEQISIKHKLAQKFVMNKLTSYIDTIKNSDEIYLIDSCFVGIVLPLLKTGRLKTDKVRIIERSVAHKYEL